MKVEKARAIILSGGRLSRRMSRRFGVRVKSLIPYKGKTLLQIAIESALNSKTVETPVVVVGPKEVTVEVKRFSGQVELVYEGENVMENAVRGARFFDFEGAFILISPDLPLLTGEDLDVFLGEIPAGVELAVPVIKREIFEEAFPNCPNKFAKLVNGHVTMASVFYATGDAIRKNLGLGRDAYRARKSILKLAIMLGFPLSIKAILGRLRLDDIEARVSQLTDCRAKGIFVGLPRLAYDIDNELNLEYLEHIQNRKR